jgi:hypothetical protein
MDISIIHRIIPIIPVHPFLTFTADGTGCIQRENGSTGDTGPSLIAVLVNGRAITGFMTTTGIIFASHIFYFI